ncbi:MAG: flagellar export chaperone FliS [Spirochaetae bacterium HGW-Spirochaetae-10]|jgi:flagellar protein FliS|nr:MAG: flagellar export chaperone FliS [Spirochaetae bacterium HGW-Spirochaetae-10]
MALAGKKHLDAYKDTEIQTADQGKLILMLYDGAIRFLNIAIENMTPRRYDVVNTNIIKAQDIVTELMLSLNMDQGGEIAQNLFNIYAYMKKRLLEGNIAKDAEILKEVVTHLNGLRSAWDELSRKQPVQQPVRPTGTYGGFSIQG